MQVGAERLRVPVLLPGASRAFVPLAPSLTPEDRKVVDNASKLFNFLTRGGQEQGSVSGSTVGSMVGGIVGMSQADRTVLAALLPQVR